MDCILPSLGSILDKVGIKISDERLYECDAYQLFLKKRIFKYL